MSETSRRPQTVVDRDNSIFRILAEQGQATLVDLTARLNLERGQAYGSVWRGRREGLVEKVRVGGRTPVWQLTEAGRNHVNAVVSQQAPAPVSEAQPAAG